MASIRKMVSNVCFMVLACIAFSAPVLAQVISSTVDETILLDEKKTPLGLYLSPSDAAEALSANLGIVFLDVRDPDEVNLIGHPTSIDANVPIAFFTYEFDAKRGGYKIVPNKDFISQAERIISREGIGKDGTIFVMCRSGGRSAMAAKALVKAGYTNVWNLVEGFEGDKDDQGVRSLNGWRNAGLPWTYKLTPQQAWISTHVGTSLDID